VLAAVACALLLAALVVWGLWSWNARRAEESRAALLVTASRDFQAQLQGAKAEQVEALADGVLRQYGLAADERGRLLEEAAALIAALPREVTPEIERLVEARLRRYYRDLRLDPDEAAELRAYREEQRLAEADVAALKRRLLDRLEPAAGHLRRGKALVERRRFAEAEHEYRRATEIDPGDPLAWGQLGGVLATVNRGDEAFACYQRALELDPRSWLTHYNLAVWHARRGETGGALARIEEALASVPPFPGAERQAVVQALLEEPALAGIRGDPRFADLIASASIARAGGGR
jgi:Flp pilus assembly protein TadD